MIETVYRVRDIEGVVHERTSTAEGEELFEITVVVKKVMGARGADVRAQVDHLTLDQLRRLGAKGEQIGHNFFYTLPPARKLLRLAAAREPVDL